ncbi:MAG: hypothetical protein BA871_11925 [Desulfuromonadales bacterium C00003096]|jgi:hypothetical protein|nr:MAG: hypothetical protein BA871_11925 [Desulfuromonadales bacterium C00003096]
MNNDKVKKSKRLTGERLFTVFIFGFLLTYATFVMVILLADVFYVELGELVKALLSSETFFAIKLSWLIADCWEFEYPQCDLLSFLFVEVASWVGRFRQKAQSLLSFCPMCFQIVEPRSQAKNYNGTKLF